MLKGIPYICNYRVISRSHRALFLCMKRRRKKNRIKVRRTTTRIHIRFWIKLKVALLCFHHDSVMVLVHFEHYSDCFALLFIQARSLNDVLSREQNILICSISEWRRKNYALCMGAIVVRKSVYPYIVNIYRLFHPVMFKHSKLNLWCMVFSKGEK